MAQTIDHPHFFKVIVEPHQLQQLSIPKQFVLGHGHLVYNGRSYLRVVRVRSSMSWKVEIIKTRNGEEVDLERGWGDFCTHFSLDIGNFVVFRYMGHNHFDVVIFDAGCTEIDYNLEWKDETVIIESTDDDSSWSNLTQLLDDEQEDFTADNKDYIAEDIDDDEYVDDNVYAECLRELGIQKVLGRLAELKTEEELEDPSPTCSIFKAAGHETGICVQREWKKERTNIGAGGGSAIVIPAGEQYRKTFKIKMRPTYIHKNLPVHVPVRHANAYMMKDGENDDDEEGGIIILRIVGDNPAYKWYVWYRVSRKTLYVHLTRGWHEFVVDNSIGDQDICYFELIDVPRKIYNVSIFRHKYGDGVSRNSYDPDARYLKRTKRSSRKRMFSKAKLPEWAKDLGIKRPCFSVYMTSSYLNRANYLHIPCYHSKVYMKSIHHAEEESYVILTVENGGDDTWNVKCSSDKSSGNPRFSAGWAAFVRDNHIRVGDMCIFELLRPRDMVYLVTIHRR